MEIIIGRFYQTEYGVVKTYGFNRPQEIISWYKLKRTKGFTNFYEHGTTSYNDTKKWEILNITDFPGSVDAVLPYVFDLFFDIKRMSQLRQAFKHENSSELIEMMRNNNIYFSKRKNIK